MQLLTTGARGLASKAAVAADAKFPAYLLKAPATEVTTLGNGVRVATEVRTSRRQPAYCSGYLAQR